MGAITKDLSVRGWLEMMRVYERPEQELDSPLPPVHCFSDPAICGICECLQDKVIEVDEAECAIHVGPVPHG